MSETKIDQPNIDTGDHRRLLAILANQFNLVLQSDFQATVCDVSMTAKDMGVRIRGIYQADSH